MQTKKEENISKVFNKASKAYELFKYETMDNALVYKTEDEALAQYERVQRHNLYEAKLCYDNPFHKPNFIRENIGYLRMDKKDIIAK